MYTKSLTDPILYLPLHQPGISSFCSKLVLPSFRILKELDRLRSSIACNARFSKHCDPDPKLESVTLKFRDRELIGSFGKDELEAAAMSFSLSNKHNPLAELPQLPKTILEMICSGLHT